VWGFASTGSQVGILSTHATRAEAHAAVLAADKTNDNPACGHWVVTQCETCGQYGDDCRC
jgi:hypothetical protein